MWYEILPSAGIIFVAMAVPGIAIWNINKLSNGNPFRRELIHSYERRLAMRDHRITGNYYKQNGLDSIPD